MRKLNGRINSLLLLQTSAALQQSATSATDNKNYFIEQLQSWIISNKPPLNAIGLLGLLNYRLFYFCWKQRDCDAAKTLTQNNNNQRNVVVYDAINDEQLEVVWLPNW